MNIMEVVRRLISRTKSDYFYQIRKRTGTNWLMRLESHGIQKSTHIYSFLTTSCLVYAGDVETHSSMLQLPCTSCRQQTTTTVRLSRKFLFNINRGNFIGNRSIFMIHSYSVLNTKWKANKISQFFPYSTPAQCWETTSGWHKTPIESFRSRQFKCWLSWDSNLSVRLHLSFSLAWQD